MSYRVCVIELVPMMFEVTQKTDHPPLVGDDSSEPTLSMDPS